MRAERVGGADHRVTRNQPKSAVGYAIVNGHARRGRLKRLPAREMPPARDRPEPVVADERREDDEHCDRYSPTAESLGPEDRGDHERWDETRRVVKVDRRLGRRRRQEIDRKLRERGNLVKEVEHPHQVGHCDRCRTIVEPLVTEQWYVRIAPLAGPEWSSPYAR